MPARSITLFAVVRNHGFAHGSHVKCETHRTALKSRVWIRGRGFARRPSNHRWLRLADDVANKLSARQHDEATWSTRSWLAFQSQRLSVALHLALAWEIGAELGLGVCCGPDVRAGGCDAAA